MSEVEEFDKEEFVCDLNNIKHKVEKIIDVTMIINGISRIELTKEVDKNYILKAIQRLTYDSLLATADDVGYLVRESLEKLEG